jgi:brefeldin A-inhibited guanine nucleotide-exchange protein
MQTNEILQREIEVLFSEIFIPILEMRTSTPAQKLVLVSMLQKLCQDPQALVEIYLNYDCDASAMENIYERLVGVVSKQAGAHTAASKSTSGTSTSAVHSPTQPTSARSGQHSIPPSLTTTATTLSDPAADASGAAGLERKLQVQSLESLVFVLRSLVAWKDAAQAKSNNATGNTSAVNAGPQVQTMNGPLSAGMSNGHALSTDGARNGSRSSSDGRPSDVAGRLSNVSGGGSLDLRASSSGPGTGAVTPITERDGPVEDDPDRFESERMRKMTMAEGVRLFNSKQKKVRNFLPT